MTQEDHRSEGGIHEVRHPAGVTRVAMAVALQLREKELELPCWKMLET